MQKYRTIIAVVVVLLGVLFIALGVAGGEVAGILQKSTRICLECVGIG